MNWRRAAGAGLMILGFVAIASMAAMAGFIIISYVEWENAQDALRTLTLATAPPALIGAIVMIAGRWIYGASVRR